MENIEKIAELFAILKESNGTLGKKVSQKMFYFFERKGINLNLKYGIYYYGPYSSKLDNAMHLLEAEEYITIDTSGLTHTIEMGSNKLAKEYLSDSEKEVASQIVYWFSSKSAFELEALATMDYVATSILPKGASDQLIIDKFKQIKESKFDDSLIHKTLKELKNYGLIAG